MTKFRRKLKEWKDVAIAFAIILAASFDPFDWD